MTPARSGAKAAKCLMATEASQSVPQTNSRNRKPWEDEILREVYAIREEISAEHGHDLKGLIEDLIQEQKHNPRPRIDTESERAKL